MCAHGRMHMCTSARRGRIDRLPLPTARRAALQWLKCHATTRRERAKRTDLARRASLAGAVLYLGGRPVTDELIRSIYVKPSKGDGTHIIDQPPYAHHTRAAFGTGDR